MASVLCVTDVATTCYHSARRKRVSHDEIESLLEMFYLIGSQPRRLLGSQDIVPKGCSCDDAQETIDASYPEDMMSCRLPTLRETGPRPSFLVVYPIYQGRWFCCVSLWGRKEFASTAITPSMLLCLKG